MSLNDRGYVGGPMQPVVVGAVETKDLTLSIAPVLSASGAYTSGEALGGLFQIPEITSPGRSVTIQNAVLCDLAEQTFTATMLIFTANPVGSTFTDKDAIIVVDGDSDKLAAMISFTSFKDVGGFKLAQGDEKSVMVTPSGTSLWVAFVVDSGTPSLGTNQLRANLNIYRS